MRLAGERPLGGTHDLVLEQPKKEVSDKRKHRKQEQSYPKQEVGCEFRRFDLFLVHRSLPFRGVRRPCFDFATVFLAGSTTPIAADGFVSWEDGCNPA